MSVQFFISIQTVEKGLKFFFFWEANEPSAAGIEWGESTTNIPDRLELRAGGTEVFD